MVFQVEIVGSIGSGKTTLFERITEVYNATNVIDHRDIEHQRRVAKGDSQDTNGYLYGICREDSTWRAEEAEFKIGAESAKVIAWPGHVTADVFTSFEQRNFSSEPLPSVLLTTYDIELIAFIEGHSQELREYLQVRNETDEFLLPYLKQEANKRVGPEPRYKQDPITLVYASLARAITITHRAKKKGVPVLSVMTHSGRGTDHHSYFETLHSLIRAPQGIAENDYFDYLEDPLTATSNLKKNPYINLNPNCASDENIKLLVDKLVTLVYQ